MVTSKPPGRRLVQQFENWVAQGSITHRDEQVLTVLAAVKVASLDQLWRLFWPTQAMQTARERLSILINTYGVIDHLKLGNELVHIDETTVRAIGLGYSPVYMLTLKGRAWLSWRQLDRGNPPRRERIISDLLVAELRTRLEESVRQRAPESSLNWYGENVAGYFLDSKKKNVVVAPAGLALIQGQISKTLNKLPLFFEVDMAQDTTIWKKSLISQVIAGYDRFFIGWRQRSALKSFPHFPPVLIVVTGGETRLQNLVKAITGRSKIKRVGYALCLREDLFKSNNFLTTRAWLLIKPNTRKDEILGADRDHRKFLLNQEWLRSLQ